MLVAVLAGAPLTACGGSDGGAKAEPVVLRRCEVPSTGLTFRTRLSSCKAAIDKGLALSVKAGFVSDPEVVGAGAAFAAICETIQGKDKVPYDDEDGLSLARSLHKTGVCPGKVSNLDPDP